MPDLYVMFSHTNTGMGRMIRAVTGSSYNHVSISLRPDLAVCYSFARRNKHNALAGGWLLFAFIGTGSSFLAFAALAAKHQIDNPGYAHKSFYYLGGLTEGTETIALFVLSCLFPAWFAWLAWMFGALCWLTTFTRVWSGYLTLKQVRD